MKSIILEESELKQRFSQIYREEQIKILEEKWNKLKNEDKQLVLEFLKYLYPNKTKLINEDKWYNTLGDVVGIFDPTGLVDLVNGISYWKQGDHMFAMLSWISVIPYLGDLVAKPVVGLFKAGGIVGKEFKAAVAAADATKIASTAKQSGPLRIFLQRAPEWGGKLLTMLKKFINKFPFIRRIIPIVENYIKLFKTGAAEMKVAGKTGKEAEAVFRGFRDYAGVRNNWFKYMKSEAPLWEKLNAGSFRIFGGNPATRSLMRRTKWYLGFLDMIGLANTVGPEELEDKVPDLEQKLDEYNKSEEGQKNMQQDIADSQTQQTQQTQSTVPPPTETKQTQVPDILKILVPEIGMIPGVK